MLQTKTGPSSEPSANVTPSATAVPGRVRFRRPKWLRPSDHGAAAIQARVDVTALAALYDCHGVAAFSLGLQLAPDEGQADLLVADAFRAIWRTPPASGTAPALVRARLLEEVRRAAWSGLSSEQRAVLDRACAGGLTYGQIADQLALSPAVVAKLMKTALESLASATPPDRSEPPMYAVAPPHAERTLSHDRATR